MPGAELRAVLGTPVEAGEDHVVAALRARGVSRDDGRRDPPLAASAAGRRRYGEPADRGTRVRRRPWSRVVATRAAHGRDVTAAIVALPYQGSSAVAARSSRQTGPPADAVARYQGGDYSGAARAFETVLRRDRCRGRVARSRCRTMDGRRRRGALPPPGSQALAIGAARSPARGAWHGRRTYTIPPDIRALAPTVPLSRDELLLGALVR